MSAPLPLEGIKVVEIGQNVAAPFGAMILADFGASVLKIESLQGDDARHYGAKVGDHSSIVFEAFNRNKEAISLDLSQASERQWLRDFIVENADVCIQSLRPGKADELGLGAVDLLALAPQLIYCNIGAYGSEGPLNKMPGYDPMIQAFSGIMSVTGEADRAPSRVGVPLVDLGTGMWLCIGVLSALNQRHQSGKGGVVDVSLLETALAWMTVQFGLHGATGKVPKRAGSGISGIAPNKAFATADGQIMITALNNKLFFALADVLGHPEWKDDPQLGKARARGKYCDRVNDLVQQALLARGRDQWVELLREAGVPCSPIQNAAEVLEHAQTQATGMIDASGDLPTVLSALSFNGQRPGMRSNAPTHGQHNAKYLPE
ncbi:MAG: CoA transferase [Gammaproteobacteria bacterium]|nr:CoA transferase [Gammaproteobacteria bacterium]MBQ0840024.1 CoA transferase [Gammaproteobacteria bacterium]